MRHIFVSPHLDDAVLSCFPLIHACLEQGMPVEIWTIMAGIPAADLSFSADARASSMPDPVTYVEKRRTEDREVGEALGADIVHFDFPDAIYRTDPSGESLYPAVHQVFHHLDLRDLYLANRIFEAMATRIQADDVVVAPSARCGHVDHVLTRLACEMLPSSHLLYEEFPYMVQSHADVPPHIQAEWIRLIGLYATQTPTLFKGNTLRDLISIHRPAWRANPGIQPRIPRKLHLIWIGDASMPPDAGKNQQAWEQLLGPKWEVRRWTNADLTTSNFDSHVLDRVRAAPHGMQKADILRYHILSREGGWYFDLDFEPIQSIEPLALALHRESLILCNEEDVMNGKISNGFFACTAGHPDMTAVAAAVLTQPLCNGPLDVAHIVSHTGPIFLHAALALANAYFLPSRLLYPVSFSEILKRNSENHPYAFARHDWNPRYRLDATLYFDKDTETVEAKAAPPRAGGDPFAILFCFVRDACQALGHWIPYHADLFGMENIVILDHGSNEETKALIRGFMPMGLRLYDVGSVPFTEKDLVLSGVMRKYKRYRYLIPLDSDEFLCLATTDGMACDKRRILDALRQLPERPVQYKLGTFEVCNTPEGEYADPWTEMSTFRYFPPETTEVFSTHAPSKSFYPGRYFVSTDAGNHYGHLDPDEGVWPTRLALAHFHTCGYRHFLAKHAQADLKLGVTDPDAHIGQKGNNWHWIERCMAIRQGRGRAYFETHICSLQGREEKALSNTLNQLAWESAALRP